MKTWHLKASRFCELDGTSRRLVLFSSLLLPLFWMRVRVLGRFNIGPNHLDGTPPEHGEFHSLEAACHLGRLVNSVAHHVLPPENCLTRSIFLMWLLRRQGLAGHLRLGVHLENGQLRAHAWVEVAGHPVNDAEDVAKHFLPFSQTLAAQPWKWA